MCHGHSCRIRCVKFLWPAARLSVDHDANNDGVEAKSRSKDDNDEHADEGSPVLCSHERRARAQNSDTDSAEDIGDANYDSDPEGSVGRTFRQLIVLLAAVHGVPDFTWALLLRDE